MGSGAFAAISFILLIVVTRLYGVTYAATIGICVTTSQLLFRVGLFSVRQYQVTDTEEQYSFSEYGAAKIITTIVCVIIFVGYAITDRTLHDSFLSFLLIFLFYQILSVDDLYQNRFFQEGRLDLSGMSKFFIIFGFICSFLLIAICGVQIQIVLLVSVLVSMLLSCCFCFRKERLSISRASFLNARAILLMCLPAFVSNLLLAIINSMPKYTTFYMCTKEESGYINDIFALLNLVELIGTFIYYPFVTDITESMKTDRQKAKGLVLRIGLGIIGVAFTATLLVYFMGTKVLAFLYGVEFTLFRFEITYTIGVCGLFVALISLLYWIPIILRDQKSIIIIFSSGFVMSFLGTFFGTVILGVRGGVIGYSMGVGWIAVLLISYFIRKISDGIGESI